MFEFSVLAWGSQMPPAAETLCCSRPGSDSNHDLWFIRHRRMFPLSVMFRMFGIANNNSGWSQYWDMHFLHNSHILRCIMYVQNTEAPSMQRWSRLVVAKNLITIHVGLMRMRGTAHMKWWGTEAHECCSKPMEKLCWHMFCAILSQLACWLSHAGFRAATSQVFLIFVARAI